MPAPACETLPESLMIRFFLLVIFLPIVTAPLETNERISTVPAAFGTPVEGAYGVVIAFQMLSPAGTVKTFSTVNCASSSRAPFGERPGVPGGTSSGARQMTSLYAPSAASAPEVWSTCTGRLMVWPATARDRIQTARCVPTAHPGALVLGAATIRSPESGSGMFASREKTVPDAAPIRVPGAADALIEYPLGT